MMYIILPDGDAWNVCELLYSYDIDNEYINDYRILVDIGVEFEKILDEHGIDYYY